MTASQCLEHEWISGGVPVTKPPAPAEPDTENEDTTCDSHPENSTEELEAETSKSDTKIPGYEPQYSEMSYCDDEDNDKDEVITDEQTKDEANTDSKENSEDEIPEQGNNVPDMEIVLNRNLVEYTSDVNTPDSESSISMSYGRLEESDSGMVTAASDYRSESEVPEASGRSSTDIELAGDRDLDMGYVEGTEPAANAESISATSEQVDDVSMEDNDTPVDPKGDVSGTKDDSSAVLDTNYNCANHQKHIDTVFDEPVSSTSSDKHEAVVGGRPSESVNKDDIDMEESETSKDDSGFLTVTSTNSDTKDVYNDLSDLEEYRGKHIFHDLQKSFSQTPAMDQKSRGRSSLGSINETIHGMQLIEKHKRAMSSDAAPTVGDSMENEEGVDYEFVSVSKRVRSYEESLSVTPPYSPKLEHSPKVAKSPRIARHAKPLHHH